MQRENFINTRRGIKYIRNDFAIKIYFNNRKRKRNEAFVYLRKLLDIFLKICGKYLKNQCD